ncbi:hypothetical protein KIN20_011729 [Parelaphostrongylus tenuis]|uniref:Uncharacterized protein n=1 Tax=Parelaphostrongylus tenuis TaxID=148309 RepID=A0AAD5M9W7_PARTN|nr:hypothetical protein KIN20_011729 [Parelaphostrongylus tenuis]
MDVRTPTMIVLPWNGATLPKEPQSSSGANGSREMVWSAERIFQSSTTHDWSTPIKCLSDNFAGEHVCS